MTEEDNFLLYYAGHGMLSKGTDHCHWLPVDADPDRQENWISNVTIVQQISRMTAKHIMVIADSCFDTRAIHTNLARSGSKTLSAEHYQQLAKIRSRTILASGGMHPVLGGDDDNHSIFSNSLLKTLEYSNEIIDGMELYRAVYEKVRAPGNIGNGQTQAPAFDIIPNTGDLGAPFFFLPD